jgi:predicted anti-sigma-YlaC factor YlaD
MNCQEYKGMIEDALDVSLNCELEASVRRHIDHCTECREYLAMRRQEHAAFFAGVNAAYSHLRSPPADFADRVVREVVAQRAARRGWRRLALPRWALIAASVAVMAGFVFANVKLIMGNVKLEEGEREGAKATEGSEETAVEVADVAVSDPSASSSPSTQTTDIQLETNQKGETLMSKVKAAGAALSAALAAAPLAAANGDGYQFINPDTYPAENPSYSAASGAITLETGALRVMGDADTLEARSRARASSAAITLDASEWTPGLMITVM